MNHVTKRPIPVSSPCVGEDERRWVDEVFRSNQFTYGPITRRFEEEFARYVGYRHAIATTSGTTALHLALESLNIGPGDEVLVPDLTFVATANAVRYTGADPVLVDVDPNTWNMDLGHARRLRTSRTKAVLPVHLYGIPCDMFAVHRFANECGLLVIDDAAEALGAQLDLGFSAATTFSFYGNKVLTTGEGGMVVTDSDVLAERLFLLRGQAVHPTCRYFHTEVGFNYRMTDLQAAIGLGQLSRLDGILCKRRAIVSRYCQSLPDCGRMVASHPAAAPWLYTYLLPEGVSRDWLMMRLAAWGIETRPTFVPLHRLPMYKEQGGDSLFPVSCMVGDRGVSLPTFPDLALEAVDEICDVIQIELGNGE